MNCNTPGFPVLQYLLGFAQIHVNESVNDSCESEQTLGDSEDRGAWHVAVHGVTKSRT